MAINCCHCAGQGGQQGMGYGGYNQYGGQQGPGEGVWHLPTFSCFFFLQVLSLALFVSVMFGAIVPRKHKSQVFLCLWHNDFKIREQSF